MRYARWLDHLPPLLAWVCMASTGVFEVPELLVMAAPLALALLVEWRRWGLGRWERWINVGALLYALTLWGLRIQLVPALADLLFLLCGARLALPRTTGQRRQVLLMAFLAFLLSALATFELVFAAWLALWLLLVSAVLMQHAWEASAQYRGGLALRPPLRWILPYACGATALAALLFLLLPRIALGLRPQFLPSLSWGSNQAGLSDRLDLGAEGPLIGNPDVVLRLVPKGRLATDPVLAEQHLGLLRGMALESYEGRVWSPTRGTPELLSISTLRREENFSRTYLVEAFLSPSPLGVIPLPYGIAGLSGADPMYLGTGPGGSLRLNFPSRQVTPLPMSLGEVRRAAPLLRETLTARRRTLLTYPGEGAAYLERWSRREVPGEVSPQDLAERLVARLRTFTYTLDNPSAGAPDPLRDFLERSRAGHCEYFASALALMLRQRDVPARVVNGYRLGAWIAEGGYYLVTQNEAHSWVEYHDRGAGGWRVADPTPPAPPGLLQGGGLLAALQRWTDATRFRWDRYVVRFSDADQVAGLEWFRSRAESVTLPRLGAGFTRRGPALGTLLVLLLPVAGWLWRRPRVLPGHLPQLIPLLRATAHTPPRRHDTVRTWLLRLARLRPERRQALEHLAEVAEAAAYGGEGPARLGPLVAQERRAWRGWRPTPIRPG
jgi:protein-glutamine gamma-glutamyltransferase